MIKCTNRSTGRVIADKLQMKTGLFERMRGLLGIRQLPEGGGIILKPCRQIHTMFMLMPIDVIFTDGDLKVLHVMENMRPWRLSPLFFKAVYTIELAADSLNKSVKPGDTLAFSD